MTMTLYVGNAITVGSYSRGTPLTDGPIVGGTLISAPQFKPAINATLVGVGNDYFHADPDGKRTRLNAQGIYQNNYNASERIYFHYHGILEFTPALDLILSGSPDAATTPFGAIFIEQKFETGVERWAPLENAIFVGGGRFIVEKGQTGNIIEYVMSQVKW